MKQSTPARGKDIIMEMVIKLENGARVDAHVDGTVIRTDQSVKSGGDASAPEPYMLFLASIGTCAGIYVKRFAESRQIPTDDIRIVQSMQWDEKGLRLEKVTLDIQVPDDFPKKYLPTLARVAGQCAVKKTILNPPEFLVEASVVGAKTAS